MKIMSETIWAGKILRVDLSKGLLTDQPTSDYLEIAIGGRGIGQWVIFRELTPDIDPYDPDNIITFNAGPLVGTLAPCSNRLSIASRSNRKDNFGCTQEINLIFRT